MTDGDRGLFGLFSAAALMLPATVVVAAEYLSIDAAQRALFPAADSFVPIVVSLTPQQKQTIVELAGPQPPHGTIQIWSAMQGGSVLGYVLMDEVIGRINEYRAGVLARARQLTALAAADSDRDDAPIAPAVPIRPRGI